MKLSFRIHNKSDIIFEYLTDMQKFVSVHPVIFKIENSSNNNYLVHETLKFGFIPFSFTYPVNIEKNAREKTDKVRHQKNRYIYISYDAASEIQITFAKERYFYE